MEKNLIKQCVTNQNLTISEILGSPLSREESLAFVNSNPNAVQLYSEFPEEIQEKLISFIQGGRGLPILYDNFFKYIMDPTLHPHRLEHFISAILKQKVSIVMVLPKEGIKLSETGSLVIMDIVVELEDGSIVDVEMQKVGYHFSGQRSSCYISDLVMRQYNRIKSEKKHKFRFSDMKPVYLIILMEHSAKEFLEAAPAYIHRGYHQFDSGAKVELLTNICYISLDTFHSVVQNIDNICDAWLTFLSSDNPEDILRLVKAYPEFIECYRDIVEFRKKPEELMSMYTDAFRIAEENTVKYMCEEQQKEIKEQQRIIKKQEQEIIEGSQRLAELDKRLAEQNKKFQEQNKKFQEQNKKFQEQNKKFQEQNKKFEEQNKKIEEQNKENAELRSMLLQLQEEMNILRNG